MEYIHYSLYSLINKGVACSCESSCAHVFHLIKVKMIYNIAYHAIKPPLITARQIHHDSPTPDIVNVSKILPHC